LTVPREQLMDRVVALSKRRGFVYPSSEIYGGLSAFYDYGPYGTTLRRVIREIWWRDMVDQRDDVVGLESSIIMNPRVWEASGHASGFSDPLVQCLGTCKERWRADQLTSERCPRCGGPLSEPRQFNLMFRTNVGPVDETATMAYLRPETAQGMFVDFKNVVSSTRVRVPFGIAQQGRSFRNEIVVEHFIFRVRELEQMEMEFFVRPGSDEKWHSYWIEQRQLWFSEALGIGPDRLRARAHSDSELSHYSKATTDIEYEFPFGWGEIEGIANRTDFDLKAHERASGEDLTYLDPDTNVRYHPYVIEPALGVERTMIVVLLDAYDEEEVRGEKRVVLRFHRDVSPVQIAVMPLSKRPELIAPALEAHALLKQTWRTEYDETGGNIGRRYRRQDEIGTPFCVTVDFDTLNDQSVTIRDRDSMLQERLPVSSLRQRFQERFSGAKPSPWAVRSTAEVARQAEKATCLNFLGEYNRLTDGHHELLSLQNPGVNAPDCAATGGLEIEVTLAYPTPGLAKDQFGAARGTGATVSADVVWVEDPDRRVLKAVADAIAKKQTRRYVYSGRLLLVVRVEDPLTTAADLRDLAGGRFDGGQFSEIWALIKDDGGRWEIVRLDRQREGAGLGG